MMRILAEFAVTTRHLYNSYISAWTTVRKLPTPDIVQWDSTCCFDYLYANDCVHIDRVTSTTTNTERRSIVPEAKFMITRITTINMNSTVYWQPAKHGQNASIQYYVEFKGDSDNWTSLHCPLPRQHEDSGDLGCLFLTCDSTELDTYYEVRIKAVFSTNSTLTHVVTFNPTDQNIPLAITNVSLAANSTAIVLRWTLPSGFCVKATYCMHLLYHRTGVGNNKTVSAPLASKTLQWEVTNLRPCTEYWFYIANDEIGWCSLPAFFPSVYTGPFRIRTSRPEVINFSTHILRVWNFNTVVYWSQLAECSKQGTQFSVYFRSDESVEKWTKSNCNIQHNDALTEFSCSFLTCNTTKRQGYQVQVRVADSVGKLENVRFFDPFLDNIPERISNVTVAAMTSKSLKVSWELPLWFCSKFRYCVTFYYHGQSDNKSVKVSEKEQGKHFMIFNNLIPNTKYWLYAITFRETWGCAYQPQYSHGATGPFNGMTLEDAPSSPPILVCGLCDISKDDMTRNGTVKWRLPPEDKWNGVPRVFLIQWRENPKNTSHSESLWYNVTIKGKLATEANLSGLSLYVEYVVRVRMCNGDLCSAFSKEMTVEASKREKIEEHVKTSTSNQLALFIALPVAVFVILILLLVLFLKKSRLCKPRPSQHPPYELPELECRSYENIADTAMSYSQLSPRDENYSLASIDSKQIDIAVPEEDTISTTKLHSDTV